MGGISQQLQISADVSERLQTNCQDAGAFWQDQSYQPRDNIYNHSNYRETGGFGLFVYMFFGGANHRVPDAARRR